MPFSKRSLQGSASVAKLILRFVKSDMKLILRLFLSISERSEANPEICNYINHRYELIGGILVEFILPIFFVLNFFL